MPYLLRFFTVCAFSTLFVLWSTLCWLAFSSRPSFLYKGLNIDMLGTPSSSPSRAFSSGHNRHDPNQQPWIDHHALFPPIVPNSSTTHYHVRIVIRVHHEHKHLVHGLIHNLRHQQQLMVSLDLPTLSMDFALVPTEQRGVPVTQGIARDFWLDPFNPFPHVYALDLNDIFYKAAFDRAGHLKCTSGEAQQIARMHSKNAMRKVCQYDNHVYYQATDVALRDLLQGCLWCTHVLVTNDDNCYHPDYFKETLLELDPPLKEGEAPRPKKKKRKRKTSKKKDSIKPPSAESQMKRKMRAVAAALDQETGKGWDLVTTDFTTGNILKHANWALGDLDLGSVLLSREIVDKIGGFIAALPPQATAMDAHNADWLFTEKALKAGALATVVKRLLFFHN